MKSAALLSLRSFEDFYALVQESLNLPSLDKMPKILKIDENRFCLSWWKFLVCKTDSD